MSAAVPGNGPARRGGTWSHVIRLMAGLLFLAGACAGPTDAPEGPDRSPLPTPSSASPASCEREQLELANPDIDVLVVATTVPARAPWYEDGDPTNGRGFESAVAYEIAERLGFLVDEVAWLIVTSETMLAPGPKEFDLAADQIAGASESGSDVDVSDGYLELPSIALVPAGSTHGADDTVDLARLRTGAVEGSPAAADLRAVPGVEERATFVSDAAEGRTALEAGDLDALVLGLRAAVGPDVADLDVLGELPSADDRRQLRFVLEQGNPLRACVNNALAELRDEGLLAELAENWLGDAATAPVLSEAE